jgi:L-fuculose-phosphate aldolase
LSLRSEIVECGRRLYARGLISGNEGNVSVREGDVLHVTPAGVCKGFLSEESIVTTDLSGKVQGGGRASTETLMHVAVYRRRPDALAIVHAHPPVATAFAVANLPLDRPLVAEAVVTLGPVPVVPYGTPSTSALADRIGEAICGAHALLMANHGALTVGDSLWRAWERMETLEQLARVALLARLLGGGSSLQAGDVAHLEALRSAAGYPPPVCAVSQRPAPPAPGPPPDRGRDDEKVTLTRGELVRLVQDAVARFSRA